MFNSDFNANKRPMASNGVNHNGSKADNHNSSKADNHKGDAK
jgi:hypothetical protein